MDSPQSYNASISWLETEYLREKELAGLFIGLDVLTMVAILVGNGLVLFTVIRYKHLRTTTNIYIISLCIADLCVAFFTVPMKILGHFSADGLKTPLCKAVEYIDFVAMSSNIFCVVAIAFDRHKAVVRPLAARLTMWQCITNVMLVWAAAGLYGIRAAIVFDVTIAKHFFNGGWHNFYQCGVPEKDVDVNKYFFLLDFFALYCIPLCIILVLYIQIWNAMHRGASKVQSAHMVQKRKRKVIKMLLMVVLVFAVCQLPAHVWHLQVYWGSGPFSGYLILLDIVDLMSFSNGWLNVVAYILFNESFSGLLIPCKRRSHRVGPNTRRVFALENSAVS